MKNLISVILGFSFLAIAAPLQARTPAPAPRAPARVVTKAPAPVVRSKSNVQMGRFGGRRN